MLRKLLLLMTVVCTSACSSHNHALPQSAADVAGNTIVVPAGEGKGDLQTDTTNGISASFAFPAVTWNNVIYAITSTDVDEVDELLGEIEIRYTIETRDESSRSSNSLPKGTKIWSITDIPVDEALAAEIEAGTFVKLKRSSP
ncbi:hypothetical protein [Paenibacillus sp. HB172176]|uniref:hypothetical protein n=1 Tax=Paenibacillus sp. HB172176 TaxID=2493690 RepID=UPI00143BB447|nr:hypothetical protein [Paenibacillus sp. HB172176]